MELQKLLSKVRRAAEDYDMIEEGDKIAVGLSGGKDSITLLCILAAMRRFYPKKYELIAISIDMGLGLDEKEVQAVKDLCTRLNVEYIVEKTRIGEIVFDVRKEPNPCSLCANMRLFAGEKIDKVLTVEASGIPFAVCVAHKLGVPAVYAKKGGAQNVSGDVYSAEIYSYTHKKSNIVVVGKDYLSAGERILIVDDFLANGAALNGLIKIVETSGAKVAGCAIAIEKGFQHGGDNLRNAGYRVESLAIIDEMTPQGIKFRA